jgi:imidazolonepropionase-like amidohydrolase
VLTAALVVAFVGATLVDGTGAAPVADAVVVVQDGRISAVGSRATTPVPPGAERIDVSGRFLIPGLTDIHVRLTDENVRETLAQLLRYGVTTAKQVGDFNGDLRRLQADLDRGVVLGPRLFTTGALVDGTPAASLEDVGEARTAVRRALASGPQFVQIGRFIGEAALDAIVDEAEQHGLKVVGNAPSTYEPRAAVGKGQYGFEGADPRTDPASLAGAMSGERVYFAPLLSESPASAQRLALAVHRAGVAIAAGASSGGDGLHRELQLLVEAGLSANEAIKCAAANAAVALLQAGDFGAIVVGARADLVVLGGDPIRDIANTRSIVGVYKDGRQVSGPLPPR